MKPVYVLFPGEIISRNDGQRHHITAPTLARLYGVNYRECMVVYDQIHYRAEAHHVHLHPRYDGNYTLPERAPVDTTAKSG